MRLCISCVLILITYVADGQLLFKNIKHKVEYKELEIQFGWTSPLRLTQQAAFPGKSRVWSEVGNSYGIGYSKHYWLKGRLNFITGWHFNVLSTKFLMRLDRNLHEYARHFSYFDNKYKTHTTWMMGTSMRFERIKELSTGNRTSIGIGGQFGTVMRSIHTHRHRWSDWRNGTNFKVMEATYKMNDNFYPFFMPEIRIGYYKLLENNRYMHYGLQWSYGFNKIISGEYTIFGDGENYDGTFSKVNDQLILVIGFTL